MATLCLSTCRSHWSLEQLEAWTSAVLRKVRAAWLERHKRTASAALIMPQILRSAHIRWHLSVPLNLGTLTGASCSFYDSMFENLKTLAKHNIWGQARLAKLEPGFPPQRPEMKWRPSPVALRGENNLTTRRKPGENCGHDRRSAMGWVLGWVLSGRSASGTWWNPIVQLQ